MPRYDVFNKELFEAEVIRDVRGMYNNVDTECTRFYEAMAKVEGVAAPWQFTNKQAELDCWKFILILANRCFSKIWGLEENKKPREERAEEFAVEHLNDPAGCPKCPGKCKGPWPDIDFKARQGGMEFYVALRDLRHVKNKIEELGGVIDHPQKGEKIVAAIKANIELNSETKNALITLVQALFRDRS